MKVEQRDGVTIRLDQREAEDMLEDLERLANAHGTYSGATVLDALRRHLANAFGPEIAEHRRSSAAYLAKAGPGTGPRTP